MVSSASSSLFVDNPVKSPQLEFQDLTLLSLGMSHNPVTTNSGYRNLEKLVKLNPNVFPFNLPRYENYHQMIMKLEQKGLVQQAILDQKYFFQLTEYGQGRFDILSVQLFS